jgi:hypothetical protein
MNNRFFEFLQIGGAMLAAYIFVATIGSSLFMSNSPKLNMEYIVSLREIPSYAKVQVSSLASLFTNKDKAIQKQVDELKQKTGTVEIAVSKEEQKKIAESIGQKTNPAPGAVFEYVAKGIAVTAKSAKAEGVSEKIYRFDPGTKTNFVRKKSSSSPTGYIEVMILP